MTSNDPSNKELFTEIRKNREVIHKNWGAIQENQKEIHTARIQDLKVTAIEGSLPAHADGETISVDGSSINVKIIPRVINVIC